MMVVNVAMYSIIKDLDPLNGLRDSQWVLTVYMLALGVTGPIYGKLADLAGGRRVMLFALALFLIGSLLCGLAGTMTWLIIFRGIQGLGAGGLMNTAAVIAAQLSPPENRAKYAGYIGGLALLGFVIGPMIGGLFTDGINWRWAFLINLPLGAIALAILAAKLPRSTVPKGLKVDYAGAGLIIVGVGALLMLLEWGWSYGWLVVIAAAAIAAFFWWEQRAKEPIIPPKLMRLPVFQTASAISLVAGFAMLGMSFHIALYFRITRGLDATDTALHMMPMIFGMLIGLLVTGNLVAKLGRYRIFPVIGAAIAAAAVAMCATLEPDTPILLVFFYVAAFGLGIGQLMQVPVAAVQNTVGENELGTASSSVVFVRLLGQSIGPAVFGAVNAPFTLSAIALTVACVISLRLPERISNRENTPSVVNM
jgi:EmrB/QacA subfamily drug resistance transporter